MTKILIDPQIESKKLSENNNINKLIVPISIEINIISYLFEIINKKNLSEDLKSRRESKEIINQLKSIFNDDFEKEKISFLLIEMTSCSYLKEKIIIKNKKGVYNFCLSLYVELCKNDKIFEFKLINELIEFIYISGFPKNEYHTIFKILLKIFEEIYLKVNESANINEFYKNKLNQFEEIITQTFDNKFKFEEEEENEDIKRDKLENFLIDFNRINEFKGIGKLLYNKMEYSDYTFGNYLLKNEKAVFNKISFYYFYKLYFDENKIKVIKSYIKFIEICKYLFSHDNNLIALFSNKNQENKDFFIFFFEVHLKFISFNILYLDNGELKNYFYSIFFYIIEYINYFNQKKYKEESCLFKAITKYIENFPIMENEYNIELICKIILNKNSSSINYPFDEENDIIKFDLEQLSNELFEDPNIIELINLKKSYKQIKKKLFSFNGPYSDLSYFYNNINNDNSQNYNKKIYKISNHLTSEFSQPLIVPILDFKFYLQNDKKDIYLNIFNFDYQEFYHIDLSYKFKYKPLFFLINILLDSMFVLLI